VAGAGGSVLVAGGSIPSLFSCSSSGDSNPVGAPLGPAHVIGQPPGDLLGIGGGALTEPGERADLGAVVLDRPAVPLIKGDVGRGHLHLGGDVGHHVVAQLAAARGTGHD